MGFKEYYKDKVVVGSYDYLRSKGLKGRITRMLELRFVDILTGKKRKKILEIGIGTGFISKLLINKGKFYGLDFSQEMINKTKEILGKKNYVKIIQGDILNLKLKEKFDVVVTIRVISHFSKKDTILALKNIDKILNKDGELIFNLENKSHLRKFLRKITNWGSTYTYQYSEEELRKICGVNGFEVEKILYLDHMFMLPLHLINKICSNKLENFIFKTEFKLKDLGFAANNFFIKARKK